MDCSEERWIGILSEVEAKYLFESYTFSDILYNERFPAFDSGRTIFSSEVHIFLSSPAFSAPSNSQKYYYIKLRCAFPMEFAVVFISLI